MAASPGGQEVGRVSVRVVPDSSRLSVDLKAQLKKIEAANSLRVNTDLDKSGLVEKAKAAVAEANAAAGDIKVKVDVDKAGLNAATQGMGALMTAGLALGPALIPIAAGLVGAFFPLVGIFSAAALGVGAFGAVLIPQITEILKARKKQTQAEEAFNKATTKKGRLAAMKAEKHALDSLNPSQIAASKAMTALSKAYDKFQDKLAPTVLPIFTKALKLLGKSFDVLGPVVKAAADALSGLLTDLKRFGKSQAGKDFLKFFTSQVGPAITTLGTVFGNVFVGITGLLKGFGPLFKPIEGAITRASAAFADFGANSGTNSGFQSFLNFIKQSGPSVVAFFQQLIAASVNLVKGLAPLAGPILVGVTALLKAFASLPTGVITAAAQILIPLVLVKKAVGSISSNLTDMKLKFAQAGGGPKGFAAALGGPWTLAIGAAVSILGHFVLAHAEAKQAVDDLAGSLNEQTFAITASTRALAVDTLQKSGALTAGRALGINLKTLTDAALGNVKAQKQVDSALGEANKKLREQTTLAGGARGAHNKLSAANQELAGNVNKVEKAVDGSNEQLKKARAQAALTAEALGGLGGAAKRAGEAFTSGLAAGIRAGSGAAVAAAQGIANKVTAALNGPKGFDSHSPSKVTEKIGRDRVAKGLAVGMDKGQSFVGLSAARLATAAVTGLGFGGGGESGSGGGGGHTVTINNHGSGTSGAAVLRAFRQAEALNF